MTTPTTPTTGDGKTLGDELRELSKDDTASPFHAGLRFAFLQCAAMADARDQKLLALVADLRREAAHLREQVAPAFYLDWRNACAREQDKAADRIEAALRGGAGTEAGEG